MERHEHLTRDVQVNGPGVYLVPWNPRTGKTTAISYLAAAFPGRSLTYVAPNFGDEGDAESGALMAARQAFQAQGVPFGFAPGKAKACRPFAEGTGSRTPNRREHARLCAERCSAEACDREKNLLKVMRASESLLGPAIPTLPGDDALGCGWCPQKAGWADLLRHRPGMAIGTSPQTLWHATRHLDKDGFPTRHDWAKNRIVVVDEAHKDDLFFRVAAPAIECDVDSGRPNLPYGLLDWMSEPEVAKFALAWDLESRNASSTAAILLATLAAWVNRCLDMALGLRDRFESLHATTGPVSSLDRISRRMRHRVRAASIARDIRMWLTDNRILNPRWHSEPALAGPNGQDVPLAELLLETAAKLQSIGSRPLTETEARDIDKRLGLASFLMTSGFSSFEQYRRFLEPFHNQAMSVLKPWSRKDSVLLDFVRQLLAHLDARGSRSPWVAVLESLDVAHGDCVVVPRLEGRQPDLRLDVLHADLVMDPPETVDGLRTNPIQPHFGPLRDFVANGGTLLLLSGTPQPAAEIQRALGTQLHVRIVEDLRDKPRPKLTVFYDQASAGEREWWDGDDLSQVGKETLDAIQRAFREGLTPHIVGTGLADAGALERWASQAGFPESHIEYARSRASLATKWVPGTIVWLRPPRLPPDCQPGLAGMGTWEQGDFPDLAEIGARHRTLRMAQEFFQTSLRAADAKAPTAAPVVLLGAGRDIDVLRSYAELWGIQVAWVKGPKKHSAPLADRAFRLGLMAQGKHREPWMAELEAHLQIPRTKRELADLTGWPIRTVNRRINDLLVAEQVRRAGMTPGRNGAERWRWDDGQGPSL